MHIIRIAAVWCSSCIVTYQDFLKFKSENPTLTYEELDYDRDDIQKYKVGHILPVILFFKENKEVYRLEGEYKKDEMEAILHEKMDS